MSFKSHYNYHPLTVIQKHGGKQFLYFKRHQEKQKQNENETSLYDKLNNNKKKNEKEKKDEQFPSNRTLLVINFDKMFETSFLKQIFKLNGKLRKIELGQFNQHVKNSDIPKITYFGMIVYKLEKDLVKCFNIEYFQSKINQMTIKDKLAQDSQGQLDYAKKMIEKFNPQQENKKKEKFIEDMEDDGFKLVTNHAGTVDFTGGWNTVQGDDEQSDEDEKLIKKKAKKNKSLNMNDFYNFQVKNIQDSQYFEQQLSADEDDGLNFIQRKKQKLLKDFAKDQEKLKQLRNQ